MWNYMHVKYFKDIVDAEEVMKVQEWVLTKRAGILRRSAEICLMFEAMCNLP